MKKAKNNKAVFHFLKNKALELRKNSMLPFYLTKLIYALKGDENVKYINFLRVCTEEWLRIKGFYKRYPQYEQIAESSIKSQLKVHGFAN